LADYWGFQEYQKGAIFRQMLEYKREKQTLESRLQELEKKSTDHDDHIRIVDAWWLQVGPGPEPEDIGPPTDMMNQSFCRKSNSLSTAL